MAIFENLTKEQAAAFEGCKSKEEIAAKAKELGIEAADSDIEIAANILCAPTGEIDDDALDAIAERHRHRYELNNEFRQRLSDTGLTFSGVSPDGRLVEAAELSDAPFYVGVQYHPEFKSRPNKPHPLFLGFVEAAQLHHNKGEKP